MRAGDVVLAGMLTGALCASSGADVSLTVVEYRSHVSATDDVSKETDDKSQTHAADADGYSPPVATAGGAVSGHVTSIVRSDTVFTVVSTAYVTTGGGSNSSGESGLDLRLTLEEAAEFSVRGKVKASGSDSSATVILGAGSPGPVLSLSAFNDEQDFGTSGTLSAGTWDIHLDAYSDVDDEPGGDAGYTFVLAIGNATSRWISAAGGDFATRENWEPRGVPGPASNATFDIPKTYTVTVGTRETDLLKVRAGRPTFRSGQWTVGNTVRALDVTGGAQLTLGEKMVLRGHRAVVGETSSAEGSRMTIAHPNALWTLDQSLTLGKAGRGVLALTAGAFVSPSTFLGGDLEGGVLDVSGPECEAQTGILSLGTLGKGSLFVRGGALVTSVEATMGVFVSSAAYSLVTVEGTNATGTTPSTWRPNFLMMSGGNNSYVTVRAGGLIEVGTEFRIGGNLRDPPALAQVIVETAGPNGPSTLDVADALWVGDRFSAPSHGTVEIGAGGLVRCGDALIGDGSRGVVQVSGGTIVLDGDLGLFVGESEFGRGVLRLTLGGSAFAGATYVGRGGGIGEVLVGGAAPGSVLNAGELLQVGTGPENAPPGVTTTGELRVLPNGLVSADFVRIRPTGRLIGERRVVADSIERLKRPASAKAEETAEPAKVDCTELLNEGTLAPGRLLVDGAFTQGETGVLVMGIAGPDADVDQDRLAVTGAATLGGKLVLDFENGYAPAVGDAFDVLQADAASSSGDFAEIEVRGLAPGAQFSSVLAAGKLTATTTATAAPLASVSVKAKGKKASEKKATKPMRFTFKRTGATTAPLDVAYELGGTASAGADYAEASGTITIPAGRKSANLDVTLVSDDASEKPETLVVRILANGACTRGKTPRAALLIIDDDPMPQ